MGKTIYGFIEKIYMFFVELLFKIIKKDLTDKKRQTFKEFLQFGLVGVSNTPHQAYKNNAKDYPSATDHMCQPLILHMALYH